MIALINIHYLYNITMFIIYHNCLHFVTRMLIAYFAGMECFSVHNTVGLSQITCIYWPNNDSPLVILAMALALCCWRLLGHWLHIGTLYWYNIGAAYIGNPPSSNQYKADYWDYVDPIKRLIVCLKIAG